MLLDHAEPDLIKETVTMCLQERGRRLPLHSMHRWWSRRFSATYRFILATYICNENERDNVIKFMKKPWLMRKRAQGKVFYEPFAGGGTGLAEAALAGWNVFGTDINPIAVEIARAEIQVVTRGISNSFFKAVEKVLDKVSNDLKNMWCIAEGITSYVLISKGKIPTWVSIAKIKGRDFKLLLCPKCGNEFLYGGSGRFITCSNCGKEFEISIRPTVSISDNLPEVAPGWRAYLVEYRVPDGRIWRRKWVNLIQNKNKADLLRKSIRNAEKILENYVDILERVKTYELLEGRRLKREGGIETLADFFTPRQIVSFAKFIEACIDSLSKNYWNFIKLAISEAAKSCSIVAKWYPPIGEPVPAAALKTYWISEYAVETNPLAHAPGSLLPLARNSIASAIRAQKRAVDYVQTHGGKTRVKWNVYNRSAEEAPIPSRIDLAVIDPPYLGKVNAYASLSLVHYAMFTLFNSISGNNGKMPTPQEIEQLEITYSKKRYISLLGHVLRRINNSLNDNGRIVLMYNSVNCNDWIKILRTIKDSGLHIRAIYWTLGEAPGGLIRSRLKGIFLFILAKNASEGDINLVFKEPLSTITSAGVRLNESIERKAYISMLKALREVLMN